MRALRRRHGLGRSRSTAARQAEGWCRPSAKRRARRGRGACHSRWGVHECARIGRHCAGVDPTGLVLREQGCRGAKGLMCLALSDKAPRAQCEPFFKKRYPSTSDYIFPRNLAMECNDDDLNAELGPALETSSLNWVFPNHARFRVLADTCRLEPSMLEHSPGLRCKPRRLCAWLCRACASGRTAVTAISSRDTVTDCI